MLAHGHQFHVRELHAAQVIDQCISQLWIGQ